LVYRHEWSEDFEPTLYDYDSSQAETDEDLVYPWLNQKRLIEVLSRLQGRLPKTRMLDVGCGSGGFVRAGQMTGWQAFGIDLSESAIAVAHRFGLDCSRTDFFDATLDCHEYDLIVMSELIEHVPRPSRFLERARDLLAPGGIIYLTTPNWNSLGRRVLQSEWRPIHPEHLSYFTPATLTLAARRVGLKIDSLRTQGLSLQAIHKLIMRPSTVSSDLRADEQDLRLVLESSPLKRTAKHALNHVLNSCGAGETIIVELSAK
jgi:2-polyprenyl-3-methyl-5-hydroxy-6-metoxy-1,4-benzoquinol methylase